MVARRLFAALVGLLVILPVVLFGGYVGIAVLVAVVVLLAVDELCGMAASERKTAATAVLGAASLVVFTTWVAVPHLAVAALAFAALGVMTYGLLGVRQTELGARMALLLVAGLVYVPVLLGFIVHLRRFDGGVALIFLLLAATWLGDTGAFFAGRTFGKHKLLERVSPNKTVEGVLGGVVAAVGGALLVKFLALPHLGVFHAIALGVLIDVAGVVGDLFESLLKRGFAVKDSGSLLPGHGGILDRIDSLLFSAPVAWAYITLFDLG